MKPIPLILFCLAAPLLAEVAPPLATTANSLIAKLTDEQKQEALFPFDSKERENWHYVPVNRDGVRIDALDEDQQKAVQNFLATSLSAEGHATAKEVIQLEALLYQRSDKSEFRNPGKYTVAFFGTPSADHPWAWRFEGHHISLNFTVVSDKVTLTTPFFFGTNPAEVRKGELKGLRPLGNIEDAARDLAVSIHAENEKVLFTDEAPREILTGQKRTAAALAKEGVPFSELNNGHKRELLALVKSVAAKQRPEFLTVTTEQLATARFAWGGGFEIGAAHTTFASRLPSSLSNMPILRMRGTTRTLFGATSAMISAATSSRNISKTTTKIWKMRAQHHFA